MKHPVSMCCYSGFVNIFSKILVGLCKIANLLLFIKVLVYINTYKIPFIIFLRAEEKHCVKIKLRLKYL